MGLLTVIVLSVVAALVGVAALIICLQLVANAARLPSDDKSSKE